MPQLGSNDSDRCPRCNKMVYFAEERRALGRKFHSACLKCMDCNKSLDSTNCNDHEGAIYCTGCYRKKYGPKGYGFAAGAAGLSMNDGRTDSVARSSAPLLSQVQAGIVGGENFGNGDICPRCKKTVYLAEKVIGAGQSFHKACFRCQSCSKGLDSTTMCQHEGDIFCKSCYSRHFGPKGYGFAGGAAGLSMDTGKRNEICRENVSHLAEAQVAPQFMNGDVGNNPACSKCGNAVYFAERMAGIAGKVYHKACFKCSHCNRNLDSTLLTEHEENIYCKACYSKNFGPKGFGYGIPTVQTL